MANSYQVKNLNVPLVRQDEQPVKPGDVLTLEDLMAPEGEAGLRYIDELVRMRVLGVHEAHEAVPTAPTDTTKATTTTTPTAPVQEAGLSGQAAVEATTKPAPGLVPAAAPETPAQAKEA